jgi:circadian clock protein KaiC
MPTYTYIEAQRRDFLTMDYTPVGIPGVDTVLGGKGFPKGHTILVSGGPGSGKTTFSTQYLYSGATQYGESGIFVTLDEDPLELKANLSGFGWDLYKLEEENMIMFINVSPVRVGPSESGLVQLGMKEFRLIKLFEAINKGIEEINAKRVVVDPLTMFTIQFPDALERRYAMRDLMRELKKTGCTNLLISELRGTGMERDHQFEEYLAQGVIMLRTFLKESQLIRVFQVEKMRGLAIDNQPRPYQITNRGIEVFPNATVYR